MKAISIIAAAGLALGMASAAMAQTNTGSATGKMNSTLGPSGGAAHSTFNQTTHGPATTGTVNNSANSDLTATRGTPANGPAHKKLNQTINKTK